MPENDGKEIKIAVYTRKSKYSDKSESVISQLEYCKQAAFARYPGRNVVFCVYADEGFSGGTAERPEYKRLLNDLKIENYAAVICYKIDRVSRSLADFTDFQQELEKYGASIISAGEGFDSSTPWGRAVLNILMVFAQLERNNVSERVRDTMLHYGRQGRWTGGVPPTGFKPARKAYIDANGREKEMVVLSPVESELQTVRLIYAKYAVLRSLSAVAAFLEREGIRTKNGKRFSAATVREILTNPVYTTANKCVYRYFSEKGAEIIGGENDFDGSFSLLPYNREDKKARARRPVSEWVVAPSSHAGTISGVKWVSVQRLLDENADRKPRLGTARHGVFSGLIVCKKCGSVMRVKKGRNGFYYVCMLKERSRMSECSVTNIAGHVAEPQILECIEEYARGHGLFGSPPGEKEILGDGGMDVSLRKFERDIARREREIENLLTKAQQTPDENAGKYITGRIGALHLEISALSEKKAALSAVTELSEREYQALERSLTGITGDFGEIGDVPLKRSLIKLLIDKIVWDGNAFFITFRA